MYSSPENSVIIYSPSYHSKQVCFYVPDNETHWGPLQFWTFIDYWFIDWGLAQNECEQI